MGSRFKISVMISSTDQAMLEGLVSKPAIERQDVLHVIAGVHEVTSVNQDIPIGWAINPVVKAMCIGDYNQAHRSIFPYPDMISSIEG